LIHRLLAHHSAVIAPNLKELMFPGTAGGLTRRVLSAVPQSKVNRVYNPDIHCTGANFPEADDIALMAAFSEGVFGWIYGSALKGNNHPTLIADKHLTYLAWLRSYIARKHPSKTVCSKYFAGAHHFEALKRKHPNAKYVLLYRDPKKVCYSLSTLLGSVLVSRKICLNDPAGYWQNLYRYIIDTYRKMDEIVAIGDIDVLVLWDEEIKSDLEGSLHRICRHAELPPNDNENFDVEIQKKLAGGPYKRNYEYSTVFDDIFDPDDFSPALSLSD
jgi:hypothetical protein